jgi:hypothetical protein
MLALASYPVGVERGFWARSAAVERTLTTLRFFWNSPQGPEPDATGHHGFYYHFLDMQTGRRAWNCELSTIDSTFLLAGALAAGAYFDAETAEEREIRALADALYRRCNWTWAQNGRATVTHGWRPKRGFIAHRWEGYDEALLLYVLGLGSPTFPLPKESYDAWLSSYRWEHCYGYDHLYAGPLFTHQLSHVWIDFRGIQDAFMRDKGIDYFENSRRATYVQQRYAIENPRKFAGYGEHCWGLTASEGPGPETLKLSGVKRRFLNYAGRGVPYGPDDGTLAPWAVVASLPFAPEIVLPSIHFCIHQAKLKESNAYGFKAAFNPTHPGKPGNPLGWWVSPWHFGLDEGPIVLMIENHRSGMLCATVPIFVKAYRERDSPAAGLQKAANAFDSCPKLLKAARECEPPATERTRRPPCACLLSVPDRGAPRPARPTLRKHKVGRPLSIPSASHR